MHTATPVFLLHTVFTLDFDLQGVQCFQDRKGKEVGEEQRTGGGENSGEVELLVYFH